MGIFNEFHKKEKPVFTGIARGVGGFGFGGAAAADPPLPVGTATGGTILTPGNGYKYHFFDYPSTPQTFTVSDGYLYVEMIIVAGGGGGGSGYYGGGGGGGAVIHGENILLGPKTYPTSIGNGGAGGLYPGPTGAGAGPNRGTVGGATSFDGVQALGGGGGGSGPGGNQAPGTDGGNAGGASGYTPGGLSLPMSIPGTYAPKGTWTIHQHPRTVAQTGYGGGDGAGGAGGDPGSGVSVGGVGVPFSGFPGQIIPSLNPLTPQMGPDYSYYGGGGAGANPYTPPVAGGFGGGGSMTPGNAPSGYNVGGGGGGSGNPRGNGGNGGEGLILIRYQV